MQTAKHSPSPSKNVPCTLPLAAKEDILDSLLLAYHVLQAHCIKVVIQKSVFSLPVCPEHIWEPGVIPSSFTHSVIFDKSLNSKTPILKMEKLSYCWFTYLKHTMVRV